MGVFALEALSLILIKQAIQMMYVIKVGYITPISTEKKSAREL